MGRGDVTIGAQQTGGNVQGSSDDGTTALSFSLFFNFVLLDFIYLFIYWRKNWILDLKSLSVSSIKPALIELILTQSRAPEISLFPG